MSTVKMASILQPYRRLKGNTRISVLFEPLWSIPFALYSFYLGLYMKDRGITGEQIGYLISIGFIASIVFSFVAGRITDALGRKRTTLIFDLLAWPLTMLIYLVSNSFWLFVAAQVMNGLSKITLVSWSLMVVEDADPEQQVAAYNLLNAIIVASGILTPIAGVMIKRYGIIGGEQILFGFAALSMTALILVRNYFYRETQVGKQILFERREQSQQYCRKDNNGFWRTLRAQPLLGPALLFCILFNVYIPIGTYSSLYYGLYLTEVLQLDKAAIAFLGGFNAGVMLLVILFLMPLLTRFNRSLLMSAGIGVQIVALLLLILISPGNFPITAAVIVLFALGFGMAKPLADSVLGMATGGKERAGIYAIYNTVISIVCTSLGFGSGYLYRYKPATIYLVSIVILVLCIGCLVWLERWSAQKMVGWKTEEYCKG
jgi:MFS family permease